MTIQQEQYLKDCRARYAADLTDNIMPFWMRHGLDREHGGVYTCVDRDGTLMDTTKSVWFQGRFGYVCASAYRHAGANPEWLAASKSALEFIERHCIDTDGHMFFSVTAEGAPVQKRRYVFSECFAAIAMAEYAVASGDSRWGEKAVAMFRNILRMLSTPGFLPAKTYTEAIGHSITMILINVALVVKQVSDDAVLDEQIDRSVDLLRRCFMHPEFGTVLETVSPDGGFIDTCAGRTINPGHCMETGWFLLDVARQRGWDRQLVDMATTIIDWAWKWGWDETFEGMINFRDCRNFPPQDYSQDMKFWWPQCETILAGLYAYIATGDEKYLAMHRKAHDYAFRVFPDAEYGEWYGYLHRDGTVAQPAKGNLFKGPFHIPRMMINATRLCDEILNK
ncbi:AGE family epimerase/isomerase [Alistipes sp. An66]|uniref:AGE family epimerase/isomerase n=1 Tax=Alistipes sp. An66 TaxID=1965650 RepID=UPI000B556DDC|nr:AGE family epimerase/isomerase [Alistipes sp. An66]OUN59567.1 N-acylglucosamine 2-epimerase [Alistipes sp. An66]